MMMAPPPYTDGTLPPQPFVWTDAQLQQVAQVAYEADRAWREAKGDYSRKSWSKTIPVIQDAFLDAARTILSLPNATPDLMHNRWVSARADEGWTHGETYDEIAKTDPELMVWSSLPCEERVHDILIFNVVLALGAQAAGRPVVVPGAAGAL